MTAEHDATKAFYVRARTQLLKRLLHWPESKITDWVNLRRNELDNPGNFLICESPVYEVVCEAIPLRLRERLNGVQFTKLAKRLEAVVLEGKTYRRRELAMDWEAARQRISEVLNELGESLPE